MADYCVDKYLKSCPNLYLKFCLLKIFCDFVVDYTNKYGIDVQANIYTEQRKYQHSCSE